MNKDFTIDEVITDNMVLQRNEATIISGNAVSSIEVELDFCGQHKKVRSNNGRWEISLEPMKAGGPYTMMVKTKDIEKTIDNILIGDVYIAAGQSNIQFMLKESLGGDEEIERSDYPYIRYYDVPKIEYEDEKETIPNLDKGQWTICNPNNSKEYSAIAYYFAKSIYKNTNIPIGIIGCNSGGTSIACWMDHEYLVRNENIKEVYWDKYNSVIFNLTDEEENKRNKEYEKRFNEYQKRLEEYTKENPNMTLGEVKKQVGHTPWPPPIGRKAFLRPCGLYNTMFKKINKFKVRAVLWYQGEEDTQNSGLYKELLELLIENWRRDLVNNNLPFIIVQLPSYEDDKPNKDWAVVRNAQLLVAKNDESSDIVISFDCGERYNIHPINKKDVGERIALLVREKFYNENVNGHSPIYKEIKVDKEKIIISFDNVKENELIVKDGGELEGFRISEDGEKFIGAVAEIKCNKVIIKNDFGNKLKIVRYAWFNYGNVNLYGVNGLPASPFQIEL